MTQRAVFGLDHARALGRFRQTPKRLLVRALASVFGREPGAVRLLSDGEAAIIVALRSASPVTRLRREADAALDAVSAGKLLAYDETRARIVALTPARLESAIRHERAAPTCPTPMRGIAAPDRLAPEGRAT